MAWTVLEWWQVEKVQKIAFCAKLPLFSNPLTFIELVRIRQVKIRFIKVIGQWLRDGTTHTHRNIQLAKLMQAQGRAAQVSQTSRVRQKNFISTNVIELSKHYRMVLESWKSIPAKQNVPLFLPGGFLAAWKIGAAFRLPWSSWTSSGYKTRTRRKEKSRSTVWSLFGVAEVK